MSLTKASVSMMGQASQRQAAQAPLLEPDVLHEAGQVFADTDEILIAALQVQKVKRQGESTGTQLLKALGAKTFLAREAPQPRLAALTVRRSGKTPLATLSANTAAAAATGPVAGAAGGTASLVGAAAGGQSLVKPSGGGSAMVSVPSPSVVERGFKASLYLLKPSAARYEAKYSSGTSGTTGGGSGSTSAQAYRGSGSGTRGAGGAGYYAGKNYPLKALREAVVPSARYEYAQHQGYALELRFGPTGGTGSSTLAGSTGGTGSTGAGLATTNVMLRCGSVDERMALLALIVALLRQQGLKPPRLTGVDVTDVAGWWAACRDERVLPALSDFAAEVVAPDAPRSGTAGAGGGGGPVLLSGREERDLQEMLDMADMSIADVGEFQSRLQQELEALEDGNIRSFLTNGPAVDTLLGQMRNAQNLLEDLDESLSVFDTKLRAMRDDVAAIEASSNALERTARNNAALLETVKGLLSDLQLPPDLAALLEDPPLDKDRLHSVTNAAWALHSRLQRLDPSSPTCLDPHLLRMRVVEDARDSLSGLAQRFVAHCGSHLRSAIHTAVEDIAADAAALTDRAARFRPPSHDRLRALATKHSELVRVVAALDPSAMPGLHNAYASAVSMLLRKEMRTAVSELRKCVAADVAANPLDFSLDEKAAARNGNNGRGGGGGGGAEGAGAASAAGGSVFGGGGRGTGGPGSTGLVSSSDGEAPSPGRAITGAGGGSGGSGGGLRGLSSSGVGGGGGGPGSIAGSNLSRQSRSTWTSLRSKMLGGSGHAGGLALPLHEAWTTLMDGFVPHLLAELEGAAALLLLYKGSDQDLAPITQAAVSTAASTAAASKRAKKSKRGGLSRVAEDDIEEQYNEEDELQYNGTTGDQRYNSSGRRGKGGKGGGSGGGGGDVKGSGRGGSEDGSGGIGGRNVLLQSGSGSARYRQYDELSVSGRAVIETLMSGLEAEFTSLADLSAKSGQQVLCLPMMATTTHWLMDLLARGIVGQFVGRPLAVCHGRLRHHLEDFVSHQQAVLVAYATKQAAAGGVKYLRVLPGVSQFTLLAHAVETLLSQAPDTDALGDSALSALSGFGLGLGGGAGGGFGAGRGGSFSGFGAAAGGFGGSKLVSGGSFSSSAQSAGSRGGSKSYTNAGGGRANGRGGNRGFDDCDDDDDDHNDADVRDSEEDKKALQALQQAAAWKARQAVDALYTSLAGHVFTSLEQVAASDAKHGDRLRADNYAYFSEAVRPLVAGGLQGGHAAALAPYLVQAEARQEDAMSRYVRAQLEYTKLWRALELGDRLARLLQVVPAEEVAFQQGTTPADVRKILGEACKDAGSRVGAMYSRVRKHLGPSGLALRVWDRLYEELTRRWGELEVSIDLCYGSGAAGGVVLEPSLEALEDMLKAVGPGGGHAG